MDRIAGKYDLVRLIGRGGMGSVWEARHATLGTRVAIKFIEADLARNGELRRRFEIEARAAASLESRYVLRVHDHGITDDDRPFIVMEHLVGESLAARASRGPMALADVASVVQQVARGLAQAHERGIVHRDLKLENIFLSHTDDEEVAKVVDFGIAKVSPRHYLEASEATTTRSGTLLGTPFYMSPEQARGLTIDHRSDLWSLGVIVFRCVLGRFPFEGSSIGDLLVKICVERSILPSEIDPSLPPAFDAWMQCALARDPALRFASARTMADALSALAGVEPRSWRAPAALELAKTVPSLPPVALPTPVGAYATVPPPKPKSRWATGLAVLAAVAGFTIGSWRVAHVADHPVAASSPPPAITEPIVSASASASAAPVVPVASATPAPARVREKPVHRRDILLER
ncbi:MAG TPA: serine/threonine-protein kinase [Polyangiaceae bacterium]|jgi:serine/threonine-protein kinase